MKNSDLTEDLFTAKEIANYFRKSTQTIYNWRTKGYLKGIHVGGSLFFPISEIQELLEKYHDNQLNIKKMNVKQ